MPNFECLVERQPSITHFTGVIEWMRIMEVEVNEHIVRISAGYVNCPTPLEIDQDVVLTVEGSVVKVEDKTNNDGTVDRVYTVKGAILYVNEEETE